MPPDPIDWSRVTRIRGAKLDKVTYEENFLVIELDGTAASFGELDKGFSDVEQEVLRRFPSIPADWMTPLEAAPGPHDMELWTRN